MPRSVAAGVQHHLRVAFLAPVESSIGVRSVSQRQLLGDDESRFGPSGDDEIAQFVGVALGIRLAGAQRLSLLEEPTDLDRSEEHTSELQSRFDLVCRLLLEKKKQHDTAAT